MSDKINLHSRFDKLIAGSGGVKPEEVTGGYIGQQREERIYPNARFNIYSSYVCGGAGLLHLTRNESNEIGKIIDDIMNLA